MVRASRKYPLVGNRMMLAGVLISMLEFISIIWTGARGVVAQPEIGTSVADLLLSFQGNETAITIMVGWLSLILSGRILMIIGLKNSLTASRRSHPIMDFAVIMAAINVVLEVLTYTFFASAAQLGEAHPEGMLAMQWTAGALDRLFLGALGVSIFCSAWAMMKSEIFSKALTFIGMIAGFTVALSALFMAPSLTKIYEGLLIGAPLAMLWMFWTGILLWKNAPKKVSAQV